MGKGMLRRAEGENEELASYLNTHLAGDAFLNHLLPLDPKGADVLDRFQDGILLCRLVCLAIPGAIAESKINVPVESKAVSIFKAAENVNKALAAVEAVGLHVVNIGAGDVIAGRSASILGLSCQLIRVHRLAQSKLEVAQESQLQPPRSFQPCVEDGRQQVGGPSSSHSMITPPASMCTLFQLDNSPESISSVSKSVVGAGYSGGGEGLFGEILHGVPFTISTSPDEDSTAALLRRWRRRVVEGRQDPTRFRKEIARRRGRGVARTRCKAREDVWRSELAARSKARRLGFGMGDGRSQLFWSWGDLVREVSDVFDGEGEEEGKAGADNGKRSRRCREGARQSLLPPRGYRRSLKVYNRQTGGLSPYSVITLPTSVWALWLSDNSPESIGPAFLFTSKPKGGESGGNRGGGGGLLHKVLHGTPFTFSTSPHEVYIGVAVQRWRRRKVEGRRDPTRFRREEKRGGGAAGIRHKAREEVWWSDLAREEFAAKEEREGTKRCVRRKGKRGGGGRGRGRIQERHEAPRVSRARFQRSCIRCPVSYGARCDAGS